MKEMKYLKIQNDGLLDIRLVYLMGGTTKSDDEFKIGQFGTGLKYTLAYLIRSNIDFKIFIGKDEVKLSTVQENIRNTEFDIICINGDRTSITTNMGFDWEPWMIIRELWCNALDEINPSRQVTDIISAVEGKTTYYIQLTPEIKSVLDNWDKYFIEEQAPIMENEKFALYSGGDSLRCYKNGILIKELIKVKSVFSYDFKTTPLNELREMTYSPMTEIVKSFPKFSKEAVEILLNNIEGSFESDIDLSAYWIDKLEAGWKEAIGDAKFVSKDVYQRLIERYPNLENEAIVIVPDVWFNMLIKSFPSISLLRASDKLHAFYEVYSEQLHDKTQEAVRMLERVGYYLDPNLKIIYGVFGNKRIIAQVDQDAKEIRLSQELENKSLMDVLYCLIEENEHYKTGFLDLTREFQTHFIELYANKILEPIKSIIG